MHIVLNYLININNISDNGIQSLEKIKQKFDKYKGEKYLVFVKILLLICNMIVIIKPLF